MAYEKQTWVDGVTPLDAEHLNHMEQGISQLSEEIANIPSGKDGADGQDGITPTIGENGNWYLGDTDTGKPSRGEKGDEGQPGKDGQDGRPGKDGNDGQPGKDGTSPVISISAIPGGHRITITDANGTKTVDVMNGSNGKDGTNGNDGTSVSVSSVSESTEDGGSNVVTFSDGKTLTVNNGKAGSNGKDGKTPVKGTDYYTESDKTEMVNAVIAALPVYDGEVVDV